MRRDEKLNICKHFERHDWTGGHEITFAGQRQSSPRSRLNAVESNGSGHGVVNPARAPKILSPGKVVLMNDSALQMGHSFRPERPRINTWARAQGVLGATQNNSKRGFLKELSHEVQPGISLGLKKVQPGICKISWRRPEFRFSHDPSSLRPTVARPLSSRGPCSVITFWTVSYGARFGTSYETNMGL